MTVLATDGRGIRKSPFDSMRVLFTLNFLLLFGPQLPANLADDLLTSMMGYGFGYDPVPGPADNVTGEQG